MIENYFLDNWLKILNYNSNFTIFKEERRLLETARIPLTSIEIPLNLLYHYMSYLYPIFVSDQQNILDVLLDETEEKIEALILYDTKIAGIHEEYKKLKENLILFQKTDLEKLDVLFSKLQLNTEGKHNIRISMIRIMKFEGLSLINQHAKKIRNQNLYDSITGLLDLIQTLFQEELFMLYPEPNIIKLVKGSRDILGSINYSSIFNLIYEMIPKRQFEIIMFSNGYSPIFKFNLKDTSLLKRKGFLDLQIENIQDLDQDNNSLNTKIFEIIEKDELEYLYTTSLPTVSSFLQEIVELPIPPNKEKLVLILQKVLFGIRNFGLLWNIYPKPRIYKILPRFLLKLIGFNLNFRKISYWAIPEFILNVLTIVIGPKSNSLLIITQNIEKRNKTSDIALISEKNLMHSILIELEDSRINTIRHIDLKKRISNKKRDFTLEELKHIASEGPMFVNTAILIDLDFIRKIIENFFIKFYRLNFRTKLKTLKMVKDCRQFDVYPRNIVFKYLKETRALSLFRRIIPILIDKHEF